MPICPVAEGAKTRKLPKYRLKEHDFTCLDLTCTFDISEIYQERKQKERERDSPEALFLSSLLVQKWVCCVGFKGPLVCSNCWALPKPKTCRPKTRKLQKYRLKQIDFTCLDLTCTFDISEICQERKERERERESPAGFFLSSLLVQTWVCCVGFRDPLVCSNCGPLPNQKHVDQKPGKYKNTD